MKVLLIGGESGLTNKLIVKLRKEKHKVFLVTGQRNKNIYFEKVFERFDFTYDGEIMQQIFHSVKPDVTVFMGAQDSNFAWEEVQQESVRYNASLTNILMSYATVGCGRFIYLSSAEMYRGNYADVITEDTPVKNSGFYEGVMQKAEELCRFYQESKGLDIVTLRMDRLLAVPRNAADVKDVCSRMCMQALCKQEIEYKENSSFSWLFETDAVEYIYRLIMAEECRHNLYQITSGNVLTERQLAKKIADSMSAPDAKVYLKEKAHIEERTVLSNLRYTDEIGLNFFCDTDMVIRQIISSILKNKARFLKETDQLNGLTRRQKVGRLISKLVPYVENVACFILLLALSGFATDSQFFARLDFYLLYVLMFAIVHGERQATVSATLATCGYIFYQVYIQSSWDVMVDYNTYIWIVQLFVVGLLVGNQCDRCRALQDEIAEEKEYLSGKLSDIVELYETNLRVKDALETQIVNQSDGIGKLYDVTASLNSYLPEEVLFQAVGVLKEVVKAKEVAIYTVGSGEYARLYTATPGVPGTLANSIKLVDLGEVYEELNEDKVYINRDLREDYPLMAAAVKNEDRISAILMIWGIPWEAMTLSTANLLTVTSLLIHNAVLRAKKYLDAQENKRIPNDTGVMGAEAFTNLLDVYQKARANQLTDYTLLKLERKQDIPENIGHELTKYLRKNDWVGVDQNGEIYILLSNTSKTKSQVVANRLQEHGYITDVVEVQPE